jgi:uncharacterized repeat protein (TIGR03803 family)
VARVSFAIRAQVKDRQIWVAFCPFMEQKAGDGNVVDPALRGPMNSPYAGLIQATDGSFYGTTYYGGYEPKTGQCARYGCGTVFKITAAGKLTMLHSIKPADGSYPTGGLMQATSGTFYGTTSSRGDFLCDAPYGCGSVFSLSTGLQPFVTLVRGAGRVGQTILIVGQGFRGSTSVQLNETPMHFTVVSDTYIRATVPMRGATGYVTLTTTSGKLISNLPFRVIP